MSEQPQEATLKSEQPDTWKVGLRLFGLSFTALFLELMVIRWVPSRVRLVAYYANLLLISSFLGLGIGAMLSSRNWRLFRFFAPLLLLNIAFLLFPTILEKLNLLEAAQALLPIGSGEWRFQEVPNRAYMYFFLALIFIFNALTFVPLGEEIGNQFHLLPPLRAYSWDLGGSLGGTIFFGLFSLLYFSPMIGMVLVVLLVIALSTWKQRIWSVPCFAAALIAIFVASLADGRSYWSPYYYINVKMLGVRTTPQPDGQLRYDVDEYDVLSDPPPEIRTMQNPPIYVVRVNQDFYQIHTTVDQGKFDPGRWEKSVTDRFVQYSLPFHISSSSQRVLVLGAGGGMDVQAAIMNGASHIDAVEIDPIIPRLSNIYNAAAPYTLTDKVTVHIDDARAFLQKASDPYDVVVFGFLDSQALFSYGASLRLDGYTYTIGSFKRAWELTKPGGVLSVGFYVGQPWMVYKLAHMLEQATGAMPLVYMIGGGGAGARLLLFSPKGASTKAPPPAFFNWRLVNLPPHGQVDLASDDWPYLYLEKKTVPKDYAIVIGILLFVSIVAVSLLRGTRFGASDSHFLFMGWGFLLLQTKSIGDCSLYFGTTWFVTTLVITGVLLMVLLANWVAIKFVKSFSPWLYLPLFVSLLLVLFVPRSFILGLPYSVRLLWTLLAVPLPIFFAGLIFSSTFREGGNPSALFGSNLIGATIGGFCEYLGMWIGSEALSYIVIFAYIASLTSIMLHRRKIISLPTPAPAA